MSNKLMCDGCDQPLDASCGYIHMEWSGTMLVSMGDDTSEKDFHNWGCVELYMLNLNPQQKGATTMVASPPVDVHNVAHGHVRPRKDGNRMRCGGPRLCEDCAKEAAVYLVQQQ